MKQNIQMKKGVSPAISWILLIGLAVSLAGIVTVWVKTTTEDVSTTLKNDVENDLRCAEISLNAYEEPVSAQCSAIVLSNRGSFTISHVKVRANGDTEDIELTAPGLLPGASMTISLNTPSSTPISIIPSTRVDGQVISCFEKEVTVQCTP